jgi:hypothetical protein
MAIAANSSERVHPFQQQVCRGAHSIFRRQLIPKKNERLSSDLKEEFALLAKPYPNIQRRWDRPQTVPLDLAQGGRVMGSVDDYLKSAQECEAWARSAQTEYERRDFLDIARAFREAAAQLTWKAQRSPTSSPPETAAIK